jgi:ClpP class serine protease
VGVKPTYISYGRYKTEGNPDEPLSSEAMGEIQARVDRYGRMFEEAVAANRGVPLAQVRSDYGQGRMLDADAAKRIASQDER